MCPYVLDQIESAVKGTIRVPGEKPVGARKWTRNKLKSQMVSMPGFEPWATLLGGVPLSHLWHSSDSQYYYNMTARIEPWTYRSEVQGVSYHLTTMILLVKVPSIVSIVNIGLKYDLSENLLTNESKKSNWDKLSWPTQVLSKITKVDSLKRNEINIFSTLPPPISPALEPGRAVPGTYLISVKVYRLSAVRLKIICLW